MASDQGISVGFSIVKCTNGALFKVYNIRNDEYEMTFCKTPVELAIAVAEWSDKTASSLIRHVFGADFSAEQETRPSAAAGCA